MHFSVNALQLVIRCGSFLGGRRGGGKFFKHRLLDKFDLHILIQREMFFEMLFMWQCSCETKPDLGDVERHSYLHGSLSFQQVECKRILLTIAVQKCNLYTKLVGFCGILRHSKGSETFKTKFTTCSNPLPSWVLDNFHLHRTSSGRRRNNVNLSGTDTWKNPRFTPDA